jgi:sugar lactone lactonase YvrE/ketopantoate hydroxymethyltransferase
MNNLTFFLHKINKRLSALNLFIFFILTQLTGFALTAPTAPQSVVATPGNAICSVAFTTGGTGGSPIISYTVTSNPGNLTATGISSPITVAGLTNGTAYTFTVTATNALGTSPASAASVAVTPAVTINSVAAVIASSAPTIGNATALTGSDAGKATVTFTNLSHAPSNYLVSAIPTAASILQGAVSATATGSGTPITLTGLSAGATYSFTVQAITSNFAGPASSATNSIAIPTLLPTAPASVTATSGDASITVNWTAPAPAYGGSPITGYVVTATPAAGSSTSMSLGNVLTATLTGLTNGNSYTVSVAAINSNGTGISLTASSAVTPSVAATVPGVPTALTVVPGDTIASAAFSAPSSNGGSSITSYTVTAVPGSGGGGNITTTGTSSPIMVTGLTNGISYSFSVKATNSVGTGTASSSVTATPSNSTTISLPGAPTSVVATAQVNAASLAFTTPSVPSVYSGGFTYKVTSSSSTSGAALPTASGTVSPITVSGLTPGASYTFTVTASGVANGGTFIGASSSASAAITALALPAAPASINAVSGNNQISVTWTSGSAGDSPITGYTITATPTSGGSPTSVILSGASASSYTISGLVNGTSYNVTVAQNSAVGTGPVATASSLTPSTVPSAPLSVTAFSGDSIITANWTPTPNASNGGTAITGYTVTATPSTGSAISVAVGPTTAAATIPGLTNGVAYTVSVIANNASGSSAAATAVSTYTPGAVPGLPNNVVASAGNTQATVTWSAPTSIGGSAIINYTITATPAAGSPTSVTVGNVSTATLTGLTNGTTYTITVLATNSIGSGAPATASSQVTPGTTPLPPTSVTASSSNGGSAIVVNWVAPSSNGGAAISGYTVTLTPQVGSPITTTVNGVGTTTATISGLTNGTPYTVNVVANNLVGSSAIASAAGLVVPSTTPSAPTLVTATPGNASIIVTWIAPSSNGGASITGYTITATPNAGSAIVSNVSGASAGTYTITGLQNGTTYTITIVASNLNGSSASATASTTATPFAPYSFSTLAGLAASAGYLDNSGSSAKFSLPVGVVSDSAGSLYVADKGNSVIRKISNGGIVTTIAGTAGVVGSLDATGTSALFNSPSALVLDSSGNLYVADTGNSIIRKIDIHGVVTTIAGTAGLTGSTDAIGSSARFNNPNGIAIDSVGNLYISDTGNSIIRKIDINGVVTTIAGTAGLTGSTNGTGSAARFNHPTGITIDTSNNLYIADTGNNIIRKATSSYVVTTIAGTASTIGSVDGIGAAALFYAPSGIAIDSNGNLFVADTNNSTIRKITSAGVTSTIGGIAGTIGSTNGISSQALFYNPSAIAVDGSGNLYIGDTLNDTIRIGTTATLPTITGQPISQVSNYGSSVSLYVTATSPLPLSYQWYKNGILINGATSSAYSVSSASSTDTGSYSVTVSNTAGAVSSSSASLVIITSLPVISSQPVSQSVTVGSSATFSVTAVGVPSPTYQWQFNGMAISGATNSSLTLSSPQLSDAGTYSVIITNSQGSVTSNSAILSVNSVPLAITSAPTSQSVTYGSVANFSVVATGTGPFTYQWNFNNSPITGATSSTYSIASAALNQAGNYTVSVTDSNGVVTTSAAATLTVTAVPLAITTAPVGQTVTYGSQVSFNVSATGMGPFTYQWNFNNNPITGATSSTYSIASAALNQAGNYTVSVTDSSGNKVTSAAAALVVTAVSPTISTQPLTQAVYLGAPANLSVIATGTAPLSYQWYLNGVAISNATQLSYSIPAVASSNAGTYSVTITNVLGSVTSTNAVLTVLTAPVITTSPTSQTISQGQPVTLSVTASGVSNTYQWYLNGTAISGATSSSYTISSASTSSAGTYTVAVTNGAGTVTSSQAVLTVLTNPGRLVNLSVLSMDGPGNQLLTIGFASGGAGTTGQQLLLIRGTGPALTGFNVANVLADPTITLFDSSTKVIGSNDDWGSPSTNVAIINTADSATGAFALSSTTSKDSALVTSLVPGPYTVQLAGKNGATGNALAEVYDYTAAGTYTATSPRLVNISCLEQIGANGILTAGFSIGGTTPIQVLVRASGPVLTAFNVVSPLADPTLTVYQNSTPIATNSSWAGDKAIAAAASKVGAFPFPNALSKDSAALITLNPGQYTVQVKSASGASGITLIEVYEVPAN